MKLGLFLLVGHIAGCTHLRQFPCAPWIIIFGDDLSQVNFLAAPPTRRGMASIPSRLLPSPAMRGLPCRYLTVEADLWPRPTSTSLGHAAAIMSQFAVHTSHYTSIMGSRDCWL